MKNSILLLFLVVTICEGGIFNPGSPSHAARSAPAPTPAPTPLPPPKKDYFIRVDPQHIIRLICKHAGMVLPNYIVQDLELVASVCKCDETRLDLINKRLKVRNLKILTPGENANGGLSQPALSVGRLTLSWDSYLRPCIEMEVQDVDILVEFVNLIFTRNNWNELDDYGFPPYFVDPEFITSAPTSTFVRIGSIEMMGEIRLRIRSRPLDQELVEEIVFDLKKLEEMNKQIRQAAQRAEQKTGRRGLTTKELHQIIKVYFNRQINQRVKLAAADLAVGALTGDGHSKTIRDANKFLSNAREIAMKYSGDVGKKADEEFESQLKNLGLGPNELQGVKQLFKSSAASIFNQSKNDDGSEYSDVYVVETDDLEEN